MKYIRFPKYGRFAVPLQGCNGFAVPDVIYEDGQRASGDRLFYFIVQNENKSHIRRGKEPQRINERTKSSKASYNSNGRTFRTGNDNSRPQSVKRNGSRLLYRG